MSFYEWKLGCFKTLTTSKIMGGAKACVKTCRDMFPWRVSIISYFTLMIIWCPFAHCPSPSERLMLILPQCSYPHCRCRYHYSMCLCIGSLCIIIYRVCIVCQVSYEISNPHVTSLLFSWSPPETWNLQRTTNLYTIKLQAKQCPCQEYFNAKSVHLCFYLQWKLERKHS